MKRFACFVAFWLMLATPVFAQWTPPVAVPMPPFGIIEVAPAPTLVLRAGDMIPTQLAAGTVVRVTGTYSISHDSPYGIECHGTADKPVFIVGAATFTKGGQISGTYCIVDGGSGPGGWTIMDQRSGAPSDHLVFRDYNSTGGFGVSPFYKSTISNIVFLRVKVHDLGNLNAGEGGGDWHCIAVGQSQNVWILDSDLSRCSGDGVQVNGGPGGQDVTGPVYVGRVTCVHNRQSCVWAKQSHGVVFSTLTISGMRPDGTGNPGACGGAQYFAVGLLFINIDCWDSSNGFIIAGYDPAAAWGEPLPTAAVAFVGNRIHNIHDPGHNAADSRAPGGAIILVGATRRYLQDNVIDDVDAGITTAYGTFESVNNTVTHVGAPPPVSTPTKPSVPDCPHTALGALGYIFGRCVW